MEMETLNKHARMQNKTDSMLDRNEKDTQQTYRDCKKQVKNLNSIVPSMHVNSF